MHRRLDLARAVAALLQVQPDLAPRSAAFDLADSLAALMDEMKGEGVTPDDLAALDVGDHSAHWARSRQFIDVITRHWAPGHAPDAEERLRLAASHLAEVWAKTPPPDPVIVAGSTGSRGATALFMQAVARLPRGAVVLPGFDFDMKQAVWDALDAAAGAEDHPQFRFARLMRALEIAPGDVTRWTGAAPAAPARGPLISLALRPAPVTDQWREEGPALPDIGAATAGLTLIEAPGPRAEALAIALCLRAAAEAGETAALITPDRVLTRQVTAALDRWGILPDDSAGLPLPLSAPGRLLRLTAAARAEPLTAEGLLALLAHPLTHSGAGRGPHLRRTRELELELLRGGPPFADLDALRVWAAARDRDPGAAAWADWIAAVLSPGHAPGARPLAEHLADHLAMTENLAAGPGAGGSGTLWEEAPGEAALAVAVALTAAAPAGGEMGAADYAALFRSVLEGEEVRTPAKSDPRIMIWGTLEARLQSADLMILAGLNEGIWPPLPAPDPWLNRAMRQEAGLRLPERQIGLSAHDFQQAIAAPRVVLSRAIRDAEAPTVPARWMNRLGNLLGGIGPAGEAALAAMRARGQGWLDMAATLETPAAPVPPAPRPAPRPPVAVRPSRLSVTRISTLIRDPYAIYAREVLRLRPLDPLRPEPDPPLRGTLIHEVLHRFVEETRDGLPGDARARLMAIAEEVLTRGAPWPAARRFWLAGLDRVADWFLAGEAARRAGASPAALECRGKLQMAEADFTLSAEADRIDRSPDGRLLIYDYKTGSLPSEKQVRLFDKQLPLEAAMAERGAFEGLDPAPVAGLTYIGLGSDPKTRDVLTDGLIAEVWADFQRLLAAWADPATGYTSRARAERRKDRFDYDHLARLGEWDESDPPVPEDVG